MSFKAFHSTRANKPLDFSAEGSIGGLGAGKIPLDPNACVSRASVGTSTGLAGLELMETKMTTTKPDQNAATLLMTSTKSQDGRHALANPATVSIKMPPEAIQVRHPVRVKAVGKIADGLLTSDGIGESQSPSAANDGDQATLPPVNEKPKSKSELMIELLKTNDGATLVELMEATNWLAHSVRGFLSGTIRKKFGLTLSSEKAGDGTRRYRIDIEVDGATHQEEPQKDGQHGQQAVGPSAPNRVG